MKRGREQRKWEDFPFTLDPSIDINGHFYDGKQGHDRKRYTSLNMCSCVVVYFTFNRARDKICSYYTFDIPNREDSNPVFLNLFHPFIINKIDSSLKPLIYYVCIQHSHMVFGCLRKWERHENSNEKSLHATAQRDTLMNPWFMPFMTHRQR